MTAWELNWIQVCIIFLGTGVQNDFVLRFQEISVKWRHENLTGFRDVMITVYGILYLAVINLASFVWTHSLPSEFCPIQSDLIGYLYLVKFEPQLSKSWLQGKDGMTTCYIIIHTCCSYFPARFTDILSFQSSVLYMSVCFFLPFSVSVCLSVCLPVSLAFSFFSNSSSLLFLFFLLLLVRYCSNYLPSLYSPFLSPPPPPQIINLPVFSPVFSLSLSLHSSKWHSPRDLHSLSFSRSNPTLYLSIVFIFLLLSSFLHLFLFY